MLRIESKLYYTLYSYRSNHKTVLYLLRCVHVRHKGFYETRISISIKIYKSFNSKTFITPIKKVIMNVLKKKNFKATLRNKLLENQIKNVLKISEFVIISSVISISHIRCLYCTNTQVNIPFTQFEIDSIRHLLQIHMFL